MAQTPPIIITAELDDAGLSPATFRVLCHLIRRGAAQDSGAWGSVEGMAKTCRMADKPLKAALRQLIETGWITRTSRPGFTSIYKLNTQGKNEPRVESTPGSNLPHPPGSNLPHPLGSNLPHEGVTGRSPKKEAPLIPPGGGTSPAQAELQTHTEISASTPDPDSAEKEKAPPLDRAIHDVPAALVALVPLLTALDRDPRQRLTPQEEYALTPILRSPAGLDPAHLPAIASMVRQRRATHFGDLDDESPLRRSKMTLRTLLEDWPNQCAIALQLAGKKKKAPATSATQPDYPWQAVCWHFYEEEPVPHHQQTRRDLKKYRETWERWTPQQRTDALAAYAARTITPQTATA